MAFFVGPYYQNSLSNKTFHRKEKCYFVFSDGFIGGFCGDEFHFYPGQYPYPSPDMVERMLKQYVQTSQFKIVKSPFTYGTPHRKSDLTLFFSNRGIITFSF